MSDQRGLYIHVPFCSSRCGYCDFNTYTPQELLAGSGSAQHGNTIAGYLDALERELALAAELWPGPVDTVFFGGGTPSMLGHQGLVRALRAVKSCFGLSPHAEVTTESNPESTSPEFFHHLRQAGFTRISLGMQSAAGHVLKVLERKHTPGRPVAAAREAKQAGFDHVNLDLIYGTPTETDADVQRSLEAVLSAGVDHVSAYSLIVEDGTAMARKVRRGQLPAPDEDVLADRFAMIDSFLSDAGFSWYEVSNWAKAGGECRHNLLYWRGGQWWGAGPGAHGCVRLSHTTANPTAATEGMCRSEGVYRLVNAKRPATYWQGLLGSADTPQDSGTRPATPARPDTASGPDTAAGPDTATGPGTAAGPDTAARPVRQPDATISDLRLSLGLPGCVNHVEHLTSQDIATERVMLGLRLREGMDVADMGGAGRVASEIEKYTQLGLMWRAGDRAGLTDKGKYLADGIITDIIVAADED